MVTAVKRVVENATCTFCGCVCDDIDLVIEGDRIVQAKNACVLGKAWFLNHTTPADRPPALIDGRPASVDEAVELAARILAEARYPLVFGLSNTTCEAQRKAVEIADFAGAIIDSTTSICHGPSGIAFQGVGETTATLGDVKNRADLVVFWGNNPAESHPRHMARYSVSAKGMFVPNGKKDRTVVLVDVRRTASARAADIFLQIRPRKDFEAIQALRAIVRGEAVDAAAVAETGLTLAQLTDLAERMKRAKFGVLCFGMGLTMTRGKHMNSGAILALARDLNRYTKFVAMPLRGHGNVTGIDNVLGWQTGFPFAIQYARGYPRFNPGEFTAVDVCAREEVDAALIIASDPVANFPARAAQHLARIPTIALDPRENETTRVAKVAFTTATYGINVEGTVYRMDNIPIRLRKALDSPFPSDEEILTRISRRLRELKDA